MSSPVAQPPACANFFLADHYVQGDRGLGPQLDRSMLLASCFSMPLQLAQAGDTKAVWYETPTSFPNMALSATCSAAATTMNVVSNYARVNDVLRVYHPTAATWEYVLVTAVSSKALTVTRNYNGSTGAICSATGSVIQIVGNAAVDKASWTSGITVAQNELYNYHQITHDSYEASGAAAAATDQSGGNVLDREKMLAVLRLNAKIGRAIFHNASATQYTTSTRGLAKGIRGWCTSNDYAITSSSIGGTTTSTTLTWAKLSDFLWKLKDAGGSDLVSLVAGSTAFNAIRKALDANVTKYQTVGYMGLGGGMVTEFISMHGQLVRMALDRLLPSDVLVAHDSGNPGIAGFYFMPVIGRTLVETPIVSRADLKGADLLTEWTFMAPNEATSGYITGITAGG